MLGKSGFGGTNMNITKTILAAGALALSASAAGAATLLGVYEGNDPFPNNLVLPQYQIDTPALYKCDDVDEKNPSCVNDYASGYDDGTFNVYFDSAKSGSWTWTATLGVEDPVAPHYMVVKAGSGKNGKEGGWAVYKLAIGEIFGGLWDTSALGDKDVSHISFYNTGVPEVVPVPAAGLMLITALGGFFAMRRRKSA
mgnify:CR=1 FL=1